ncbi:MAG: response regulator, partial [Chloroflexi bacterium]|nr:response regulator [Chloroflexota bacterium]
MSAETPTILILDRDSHPSGTLFGELEALGYRVIAGNTADHSLENVQSLRPDVILADLQLPGLNGLELLEALTEVRPESAFISTTDNNFTGLNAAVETLENGAFAYCTRPLNLREVQILIRHALRQQRMLLENQVLVESIQQSYTELSKEVADRKRTEEILAERTAALASVGELASEIAHELNNPLAAVMTFAHLLKSQDLPGSVGDDVDKIFTESQRAARVVQNLLAFARRHEPEKRYVDVTGAVSRALSLKARDLSANNIEVRTHYESGLPKTMADEHQLTQVFLNIVTNADQTMAESKGKGNLWIRGWKEGSSLCFSFRDDGPGISKENQEKVFDPFFTTKESGKGTGLGLSMCYRMVRAHGGKIWLESEEGQGTTFYVELPVELPEEGPEGPAGDSEEKASDGLEGVGKITVGSILVVDDEAVFTDPLCRILSREGHVVEVARDGDEAWQAIGKKKYDCILMDVRMPGMGGKELYRRIKGSDEELAKKVIFATGDTLNPETQDFLENTGNLWLGKPFTVEELEGKIQECLA